MSKRQRDAPVDTVSGESETNVSIASIHQVQSLDIYNINIRCLLAHKAELEYHLEQHKPHIVFIQET